MDLAVSGDVFELPSLELFEDFLNNFPLKFQSSQ
jgi:hypothetical protein